MILFPVQISPFPVWMIPYPVLKFNFEILVENKKHFVKEFFFIKNFFVKIGA